MTNKVQPIPEGFQTLTAYLIVADAKKEIEFLKAAFDAQAIHISKGPDGSIRHATLKVGTSMLMMGQSSEMWRAVPAMMYMYVEDVDAVYKRALACGAKSVREPADQIYGDRSGAVESANGIQWWMSTHIEDVSEEELQRRSAQQAGAH